MSSAETQEGNNDAGPDTPEPGIAEYDSGVLQLGDTELDGVPDEEIVDRYSDADVDAVVYHGDASKKHLGGDNWVDQEEYLDQLESTYESLNRIGEELDVDVLTLPGNHAPVAGNHHIETEEGEINDEEYMEEVEELVSEEYDEFSEFDGNAYEFFVDSDSGEIENDNIVDFTGSVYEAGDVSLVGLGTHMGPELDEEAYSMLNADVGLEELGYGEEELEDAAEELSEEPGFEYGFLSDIPLLGGWIEKIGDRVAEMLDYGAVHVDPEDISLDDLEELGEDFMTEEHIEYLEQIEEVKESEGYEEFVEKKERIESLIESAEGEEIALFNHSTPIGEEKQYGSMALRDAAEEYDLAMIGGGHSHESRVYDIDDTPVVNAAQTYTEIGFGDELYTEQHSISGEAPETEERLSEEEKILAQAQTVGRIEQAGGPEEFLDEALDESMPEQQRRTVEARVEDLWENRERVMQQAQDIAGEAEERPQAEPADEGGEEAAA